LPILPQFVDFGRSSGQIDEERLLRKRDGLAREQVLGCLSGWQSQVFATSLAGVQQQVIAIGEADVVTV